MTSESEVEQSDRSKADLNSTALQLQELISTVKSGLKTKIMIVLFLIIRLCCGQKTDDTKQTSKHLNLNLTTPNLLK